MADSQLAARFGDKIAHSGGRSGLRGALGFLAGALIGGALAALAIVAIVGLTVFTGGLGTVALVCAVGAVGATGLSTGITGALMASNPGSSPPKPSPGSSCGTITSGSPNVMIENQKAARAGLDHVSHEEQLVAQGSQTVAVNNAPLARLTDKAQCAGVIVTSATYTNVGGPPATVVKISEEEDTLWGIRVSTLKRVQWWSGLVGNVLMAPFVGIPCLVGQLVGQYALGPLAGWTARKLGASKETSEWIDAGVGFVSSLLLGKTLEGAGNKALPAYAGVTRALARGQTVGEDLVATAARAKATALAEATESVANKLEQFCLGCGSRGGVVSSTAAQRAALAARLAEKRVAEAAELAEKANKAVEEGFNVVQKANEALEGAIKKRGEQMVEGLTNALAKIGVKCPGCGEAAVAAARADHVVVSAFKSPLREAAQKSLEKSSDLQGEQPEGEKDKGKEGGEGSTAGGKPEPGGHPTPPGA
jgi:uncharacterized Zn-binding protein involved in type VI secretion